MYDIVGARRDVRRFRPDPIAPDLLTRVLGAAHSAPSVGHSQPWRFVVVREPRTAATGGPLRRGVLDRAPFVDTDVWSCACAIENLWLAARAEGLGVGWVTLFDPAELAELLGLPDGVVTSAGCASAGRTSGHPNRGRSARGGA